MWSIESLTRFFVIGNIFSFLNLKVRKVFLQYLKKYFSKQKIQTKNSLEILETFFCQKNFFENNFQLTPTEVETFWREFRP